MSQPQDIDAQLAAAHAQIHELSQQLATERNTSQQVQTQLHTQLKQQQQRLTQLEAQSAVYRHMFDCNPQPMWVYDLETLQFLAVNAAAVVRYGYSEAEFLAMTIADIRPSEDVPRLLENLAQVNSGLDLAGIWQHRLRDGQIILVEIVSYALEFAGRRAELVMAQDVTRWVNAEHALHDLNRSLEQTIAERTAALAESQTQLQLLLDTSPATTYSCQPNGDYACLYISSNIEVMLGYTAAEYVATPDFWKQQLHPDDVSRVLAEISDVFAHGTLRQQYRLRHRNGHYIWVCDELTVVRDAADQPIRLVGYMVDITEQKRLEVEHQQVELKLQALTNRLTMALQAGAFGTWDWDMVHDAFWDERMYEIYGLQNLAQSVSYQDWRNFVHPDDINRVETEFQTFIQGKTAFSSEFRIWRADGELRWLQHAANPQYDANGTVKRIIGLAIDITDRKQTEIQLKRQLATIEAAVDGIGITQDNIFVYVNRAQLDMFGYTAEELLGQSWTKLYGADELVHLAQEVNPILLRDRVWRGEIIAIRKDGSTFAQELSLSLTDDGLTICICKDISDRKQAEQELQESQQLLQSILDATPIPIFWKDRQLVYQGVNAVAAQNLGLESASDCIGLTDAQLPWYAEDAQVFEYSDRQIIASGQSLLNEIYHLCLQNGRDLWFELNRVPLRDVSGTIIGVLGTAQDVTHHKRAELALQDLNNRLTLSLQAGGFGSWEWDYGHQMIWDARMYEIFGLPDLGQTLTVQDWRDRIHPDDLGWVEMNVEALVQGEGAVNVEYRICRPDGEVRWVQGIADYECDAVGNPVRVFGLNRDITSPKQAEQALQASQTYFQSIVADQTELICRFLPDGTLSFVNNAYCQFFQKSPDELIGQRFTPLLPEEDQHIPSDYVSRLSINQPVVTYEHRVIGPDGSIYWQQWTDRGFFAPDGSPIEFQAVGRDITPMKEAEAQLRYSNQELQRATRLKDEFLANMSHELRTPLNAILGMTEALQDEVFGIVNDRQLNALRTVERSGIHLLALINDILDVAKIASGQVKLEYSHVSVEQLCASSLAFVKQQALKKEIHLKTHIPPYLPDLYVDEIRIRQVLLNLLTNAVKFTPEGGTVTLTVSLLRQKSDTAKSPYLRIAIADTGIGIAAENIPRLFKPFVQIDSALNRKQTGTGLGLALAKQIVELHGGQIELTSELEVGSYFTVDLPYQLESVPAAPPDSSAIAPDVINKNVTTPSINSSTTAPPLVLLAEDNPANVATISSYLEAKGYHLVCASNGEEAIDLALSHQPDLILMDVQMPDMDGLEAIKQIRQQDSLRQTPIIVLTALAMKGDREQCLAAGANEYLSKPVKLKQLDTSMRELLAD